MLCERDTVLDVANGYAIDKESKFRGQHVEIEILVPVGRQIRFDESVQKKLNAINIRVKRSYRRDRITGIEIDNDERAFRFRTGVDYTMGLDGELKASDGSDDIKPAGDEYRYDNKGKANDSLELEKTIQQKKKELQELEEKKKKQEVKSTTSIIKGRKNSTDGSYASGPNPASSLVEWF